MCKRAVPMANPTNRYACTLIRRKRLKLPGVQMNAPQFFTCFSHCELDAAYFHLYGIARDDTEYILDTFPIVRRKDIAKYRTQRVILEIYDELAEAIATGVPYVTRLDPPPGDSRVAHPLTEL
jgi:hypothetical protein